MLADKEASPELLRRARTGAVRPNVSLDDIVFMAQWPVLRIAAVTLREGRWPQVARALERVKLGIGLTENRRTIENLQRALHLDGAEARRLGLECMANRTEQIIHVARVNSRSGWAPWIRVTGKEHLESARTAGRGAVLWVSHFCFGSLLTKMALRAAGYDLVHLSRPEHGFSKSKFGIRWLNGIRISAESKFLKERIEIQRANPGLALRRARRVLQENGFVSITAGAWEGSILMRGRLLGGGLTLAAGAPGLAHLTGAALIPVISVRRQDKTAYEVRIGAPIVGTPGTSRETYMREATQEFLSITEHAVAEYPAQWRAWKDLSF
jgi:hypothetical protein